MKQVFAYKNVKVPFWVPPFFTDVPKETVVREIQRTCILNREECMKNHLDECQLYWLGEFDDDRGVFRLAEDQEFLLDLAPYFKE